MCPIRMSRLEASSRIIIELVESFNHHDINSMMGLVSDDCVFETANSSPEEDVYTGKQVIIAFLQDFFRQAPQAHIDIEEILGMGYRCVLRWKFNHGDAIDPIRGMTLFRVKNERVAEILSYVKVPDLSKV